MSKCNAVQFSDQMSCSCGNVWDMNDPCPPACRRDHQRSDDKQVVVCNICRVAFDDRLRQDCGGDCLLCMADSGDTDCMEVAFRIMRSECETLRKHLQNLIDQTTPLEPVPGNPMWSRRIQLDEVVAECDSLRAECEKLRKRAQTAEREHSKALRTLKGLERVAQVVSDNSDAVCSENNQLRVGFEKLRKDAERYRWLRDNCEMTADEYGIAGQLYFGTYQAGRLGEAIDAAMEGATNEGS